MSKLKPTHTFRVGDVVKHEKERKPYVVSGTKGWIHAAWRNDDGTVDSHISLAREIGATSFLTNASRCKLITPREKVGKKWWEIFPDGEK